MVFSHYTVGCWQKQAHTHEIHTKYASVYCFQTNFGCLQLLVEIPAELYSWLQGRILECSLSDAKGVIQNNHLNPEANLYVGSYLMAT